MNGNIFRRELRAGLRGLLIWCACMALGVISGMAKYPTYSAGSASARVFQELPRTMQALMGMGDGDVTTLPGFYAFLFRYVQLAFAFHAALLGCGVIGREERDKTAEFLLAKPVSRGAVVTAKLLAALAAAAVLNLVTFGVTVPLAQAYGKGQSITGEVAALHASLFFLQMIFLSLGALVAAVRRSAAGAGAIAAVAVLGTFVVAELTSLVSGLGALNVLTPFHYFSVRRVLAGNGLDPLVAVACVLLTAVFTVGTYVGCRRRDPHF